MASTYGTSGIWSEITAQLEAVKLKVERPNEIQPLLQSCAKEYAKQFNQARHLIEEDIAILEQQVAQEREKVRIDVEKYAEQYALEIKQAELHADYYRNDRHIFNLVRSFFRIQRETGKLSNLKKNVQDYRDEIEHDLREKENLLEDKKTNKDKLAEAACAEIHSQVDVLKNIIGSPELANAVTELGMIETLSRLPDNYHVLNDVRIKLERGIKFDGEWFIQGQISNLVVSPAGLFAIELNHGMKQSSKTDADPDPREQIRHTAQLLYLLVKPEFPTVSVRSILVHRGSLPDNQKTQIVKTLTASDVPGYVTWFKENTLDDAAMQKIVSYIQSFAE
jgi:hypothetical protein